MPKKNQSPNLDPVVVASMLLHSNLPTVLVEGVYDVGWYRVLLRKGGIKWSLQPAGGRNSLFVIHDMLVGKGNRQVVYVADRDMFSFTGIPSSYADVVFTSGYSIENDVLKDSYVHRLFTDAERQLIAGYKGELAKWFSFCAEQKLAGKEPELDVPINAVAEHDRQTGRVSLKTAYLAHIGYVPPAQSTVDRVLSEFEMIFRGKCLLGLYAWVTKFRHPSDGASHSEGGLMDVAVNDDLGAARAELVSRIDTAISMVREKEGSK